LDAPIPWDTYEKCIDKLESNNILLPRPKKKNGHRSQKREKILSALTEEARKKYFLKSLRLPELSSRIRVGLEKKTESQEERYEKLYQLILYFDAVDKTICEIPSYETKKLEELLSLIGKHSLEDLDQEYIHRQDIDRVTITYYKPPSECIRIWKKEYRSKDSVIPAMDNNNRDSQSNLAVDNNDLINDNDNISERPAWIRLNELIIKRGITSATTFLEQNKESPLIIYYLQISGVAVKDLLYRERFMFKNIIFSKREVRYAFNMLSKLGIIVPLGSCYNEAKYTTADNALANFVIDCWNVYESVMQKISMIWMYNKEIMDFYVKRSPGIKNNKKKKLAEGLQLSRDSKRKKREWLELSRGYIDANSWIIGDQDFQISSNSNIKDKKMIENIYQEIRIWEKLTKDEFQKLSERHSVIINKYKHIAEPLLKMIYPPFPESKLELTIR
jgi:hypothetical protein